MAASSICIVLSSLLLSFYEPPSAVTGIQAGVVKLQGKEINTENVELREQDFGVSLSGSASDQLARGPQDLDVFKVAPTCWETFSSVMFGGSLVLDDASDVAMAEKEGINLTGSGASASAGFNHSTVPDVTEDVPRITIVKKMK